MVDVGTTVDQLALFSSPAACPAQRAVDDIVRDVAPLSAPPPAPRPPRSPPVEVVRVAHRARDAHGRRLGHVAYVQRRAASKLARYGGRRFAAWAVLTRGGVECGAPERFDTFATEAAARAHATRAAKRAPAGAP